MKKNFVIVFVLSLFLLCAAYALTTIRVEYPVATANITGTIILNVTTNGGANNVTWSFYDSSSNLAKNITAFNITVDQTAFNISFSTTSLSDGIYNLTINASNETGTSVGNTSIISLTIDNTAPSVTLLTPANNSNLTSGSQIFNATVTDTTLLVNTVKYNLTNRTGSVAISAGNDVGSFWNATQSLSTLAEGVYNLTIQANDTVGNRNHVVISHFAVDRTAPVITLITVDNSNFSTPLPTIQLNVTDNVFTTASCYVFVDNVSSASNVSTANATSTSLILASMAEGNHTYFANCTDSSGNVGSSALKTLLVDFPPNVTIIAPSTNAYKNESFVINVTATSAASVRFRLENDSIAIMNYTPMSNSAGSAWNGTFTNFSTVPDGNYTLRVNATDAMGYVNATVTIRINIDITDPASFSLDCSNIDEDESPDCNCGSGLTTDNSQSFGGTISYSHNESSVDTSTAGTKSVRCTATDLAGNYVSDDDTFTVTASSSSSGSGGGGGGSYIPSSGNSANIIAKSGKTWSTLTKDTAVSIILGNSKIAITSIVLTPNQNLVLSGLDVASIVSPSSAVPPGTVYQYLEITPKNLPTSSIGNATIFFRVPLKWFNEENVLRTGIKLMRYSAGWKELQTAEVRVDALYAYYQAATPGFSTFAILTAQESASDTQDPLELDDVVVPQVDQNESNGSNFEIDTPQTNEKESKKKDLAWVWWVVVVLVIAAVAYLIYTRRDHHPQKKK